VGPGWKQFDELQTCSGPNIPLRRPACNTLLDVFVNIKDDEIEHVKTMHACQDAKQIAQELAAGRQRSSGSGGNGNGSSTVV
jgi:ubiquinol oxidase